MRKQNSELEQKVVKLGSKPQVPENIASFEETFKIRGHGFISEWDSYARKNKSVSKNWTRVLTWEQIFELVSPYLLEHPNDAKAKDLFVTALDDKKVSSLRLNEQD